MSSNVPSIRLIVPTPDVSAYTDPNASTSITISPGRAPSRKKSSVSVLGRGIFGGGGQTPYNTTRDFSDIVRRVGGDGSGSMTGTVAVKRGGAGGSVRGEAEGRGGTWRDGGTWEDTAQMEGGGGEGMILIKKKVKTRGRVDGVFPLADSTNVNAAGGVRPITPSIEPLRSESRQENRQEGKWWNLTRGRKDTGGSGNSNSNAKDASGSVSGVLGFVRRSKSPGPSASMPPTPTLESAPPPATHSIRGRQDSIQFQTYLPGEPDCTLDMVEVPSVRGRAVVKDLPILPPQPQVQPFPAHGQKRFNSLGASSALPSNTTPSQARPDYQRSVSAGSAALLHNQQQSQAQSQGQRIPAQYAHLPGASAPYATMTRAAQPQYSQLPGASAPYATMTRAETYTPPKSARPVVQKHSPEYRPQPQRSASAMAVYSRGDTAEHANPASRGTTGSEFKRSTSTSAGMGTATSMSAALVGSGILLGAPASTLGRAPTPVALSRAPTPVPGPRSGTPTAGGLLAPPGTLPLGAKDKEGSIAVRAMRSVRSMARLGTWDREEDEKKEGKKDGEAEGAATVRVKKKVKAKVKEEGAVGKEEKKERKEREKREKELLKAQEKEREKKEKGKLRAPKSSGSSFEVGALSTSPVQRKRSILGLGLGKGSTPMTLGKSGSTGIGMGLPSSLSIGRSATGGVGKASTASSVFVPATNSNAAQASASAAGVDPKRLSADDVPGNVRRESTNSSLRPLSVLSSGSSAGSRVSSGSSIRWAEDVVDRVRGKRSEADKEKKLEKEKKKATERESRRTSEGRRRTPLSDVFPGLSRRSSGAESTHSGHSHGPPMLTVEEATTDGHGHGGEEEESVEGSYEMVSATPVKRPRTRPVSDEMIANAKTRPRGIIEDAPADGVLTLLDAATNDLAQLITHLNLDATPGTPSPARGTFVPRKEWQDSPTGKSKTLRPTAGSVSSLRPYAARAGSSGPAAMLGQQIAPWPTTLREASPTGVKAASPSDATFKRMHRRTMTPTPEPDPEPVFHPLRLRPSRIRPVLSVATNASASPPLSSDDHVPIDMRAPSSLTFGSRSSSGSVDDAEALRARGLPPVFTRGHARNRSSLLPDAPSPKSSRGSTQGMPLARETKRVLGMGGTMGGSDKSGYEEQELDASDPDSDIPNELQVLLSASRATSPVDDTLSFRPPPPHNTRLPSPGLPPHVPLPISPMPPQLELPVFHVELAEDDTHHGYMDEGSSEEDTKKSFDFTGELQKLNESGGSDRRSFVEQLENAFKTPAKLDLRGLLTVDVPPPLPSMPVNLQQDTSGSSATSSEQSSSSGFLIPQSVSLLVNMKEPTITVSSGSDTSMDIDGYAMSRIVDLKEPTLLPGSDSLTSDDSLGPPRAFASGPSNGQLNVKFKFGGDLPAEEEEEKPRKPPANKKPLTLSDIIPPPSHVRSQSLSSLLEEDDSVLKSIFANAADIELPRPRVNSDSSARFALENARNSVMSVHSRTHSRPPSGISFTGFDSFEEVRRGFEFHNNRPAFYPPPAASNRRVPHMKQDSLFSIASVSSYGNLTKDGAPDPFEYGLPMPSLRERPSSEEDLSISMSINVDDTFAFLDRDPQRRQRVASDASSFYFKAPSQPSARGHRRRESNMSVSSQGPPISFYNYNRSFGNHRLSENDTSTSGSSLAHQYAAYGADGGRAAWAKHRQDSSVDSMLSDFSVARLGRPGVGEKMFDTAGGMPLSAISASPPESHSGRNNRSSFDSIIDEERRSSMEDSLFEKTGHRSSMSSDSVFGYDELHPPNGHLLPPHQFRPLSVLSMNTSIHSPMREDDTMISMLGGGHVRRRSIGSTFEASPCVRVEKRKHTAYQEDEDGPNKARIVTKASIASTSSSKFGGERMIKARQGLLVRQSLEESALVAAGEEMSIFHPAPVFSRPSPNSRSRSSTITTSSSSGAETPPLSSAEDSMSDGSQFSIDMSQVNVILSNSTHPMSSTARDRVRARARGQGHRRRVSVAQARASRSSVYETIQEEFASPAPSSIGSKKSSSPTALQGVFIVNADAGSVDLTPGRGWDDEHGIVLRRYYALRHEAEDTVTESRRMWSDTSFSRAVLQDFLPPKNPAGMQALLQHSVQTYGPLPSELGPRRVRSRTQSRASPYPRQAQSLSSPEQRPSPAELNRAFISNHALQALQVKSNIDVPMPPPVISPKRENAWGLAPNARPRVASAARRSALGWAKRSTKASTDLKENNTSMSGMSFMMTPGESLRISRPRPRGRPTPARAGAATPRQAIAAI
ncbi:hypothetical protein C8F04DRAFT_1176309 [Mycena alexandri]|uniref:Uncharacterized protein n=1 Tax=Mycena alexandri TaxID=1745969 RepID=A0AAD6TEX9_9AGAR|nr:hypothetical protein C8F04DRAFT_1176309 [Mycena alexandri]